MMYHDINDDQLINFKKQLIQLRKNWHFIKPEEFDNINKIKKRGLEVRCHGVFDEDLMIKAVKCGVDGMTINFPDKLRDYLSENGYLID